MSFKRMAQILASFAGIIIIISVIFDACSSTDADELSSVRKPNAETQAFIDSVDHWMANQDLNNLTAENFNKYIYARNPRIDFNVLNELTAHKIIKPGEKVKLTYLYYSTEGKCLMQDSTKSHKQVKFSNKFVVQVNRENGEKLYFALACLNGMLQIDNNPDVSTEAKMSFIIEKGQGLSTYLHDDLWSIEVGEAFGLDFYSGKIQKKKYRITPQQARQLAPKVSSKQITVHVEPGWHFKLDGSNWTLNGRTPIEWKVPNVKKVLRHFR